MYYKITIGNLKIKIYYIIIMNPYINNDRLPYINTKQSVEINSRNQIQNGLNQRQSIPTNMNYPINNSHTQATMNYPINNSHTNAPTNTQVNSSFPIMDRNLNNRHNNIKPVQHNMQSQYQFEKINIMELPKQPNMFMDNKPIDTRRQVYENNRQKDDLFYKNQQGNLYNYVDNTPSSTRLHENRQTSGVDLELLQKKSMNIPKDHISLTK